MTTYFTPELCKAARILLNWQQRDLAKAANVSLTAVSRFENALGKAQERTTAALINALSLNGIEFLPEGGLRKNADIAQVRRFAGKDFVKLLNEDIYAAVRKPGSEIVETSVDESLWMQHDLRTVNEEYKNWFYKMAIQQKSLVPESKKVFNFPEHKKTYRCLPDKVIGKISYAMYADRIAFILWKKRQIIVLRNAAVADTFREQFKCLWHMAKPV